MIHPLNISAKTKEAKGTKQPLESIDDAGPTWPFPFAGTSTSE
jgi:hypothetical protein